MASVLELFSANLEAHVFRGGSEAPPVEPVLIAELVDIEGDEAVFDARHLQKQPDWTYGPEYSGQTPAERYGDHRSPKPLEE
jgi:hypothetical protein